MSDETNTTEEIKETVGFDSFGLNDKIRKVSKMPVLKYQVQFRKRRFLPYFPVKT